MANVDIETFGQRLVARVSLIRTISWSLYLCDLDLCFRRGRNLHNEMPNHSKQLYIGLSSMLQIVQFHLSLWSPTSRHPLNINLKNVWDAIAASRVYIFSSSIDVADAPNRLISRFFHGIPALLTPFKHQTKQSKKKLYSLLCSKT